MLGLAFIAVKTFVHRLAARATVIGTDLVAVGAEVSLGAALAITVQSNLWYAALLLPVLVLVERLQWRPVALRREVAVALETFANIVDERDRSTHALAAARASLDRFGLALAAAPHAPRERRLAAVP